MERTCYSQGVNPAEDPLTEQDRARIADKIRAAFKAHFESEPERVAAMAAEFRAILERHGRNTDVPSFGTMPYLKRIWRQTGRLVGELWEKTPHALVAYLEEHFQEPKFSAPPRAQSVSPRPDASFYSLQEQKYRKRLFAEIKTISERTILLLMPHNRGRTVRLLRKMQADRDRGPLRWVPPPPRKEFGFDCDRDELIGRLRSKNYRGIDVDPVGRVLVEVDDEALLNAGEVPDLTWLFATERRQRHAPYADRAARAAHLTPPPTKHPEALPGWISPPGLGDPNVNPTYPVGESVEHARFGPGVVLAAWSDKIDVLFTDGAVRKLQVAVTMLKKSPNDLDCLFQENAELDDEDESGEQVDDDFIEEIVAENAEEFAAQELDALGLAPEVDAEKTDAAGIDQEGRDAENTEELDSTNSNADNYSPPLAAPFELLFGYLPEDGEFLDVVGSDAVLGRKVDQALSIDRPRNVAQYVAIAHKTGERRAFINHRDALHAAHEWLRSTPEGGDLWSWDYRYRDKKTRRTLTEYQLVRRVLPRKDPRDASKIRRELFTRTWGPQWPVVLLSPPDEKPDISLAAAIERALYDPAQASDADRAVLSVIEGRAWEFGRKFAISRYAYQDRRSDYEDLRGESIRIALANRQDFPVGHRFLPGALYKLIGERLRDSYHDQFRDVFTNAKGLPQIKDDAGDTEIDADASIEDAPDEYFNRNGASAMRPFDAQPFDLGLLDSRQRKIVDLKLGRGLTIKAIAADLDVNEKTVRRDINSAEALWRAAKARTLISQTRPSAPRRRRRCHCGCAGEFDPSEPGRFDQLLFEARASQPSRGDLRAGRSGLSSVAHTRHCLMGSPTPYNNKSRIAELGLEFVRFRLPTTYDSRKQDLGQYTNVLKESPIFELMKKNIG